MDSYAAQKENDEEDRKTQQLRVECLLINTARLGQDGHDESLLEREEKLYFAVAQKEGYSPTGTAARVLWEGVRVAQLKPFDDDPTLNSCLNSLDSAFRKNHIAYTAKNYYLQVPPLEISPEKIFD